MQIAPAEVCLRLLALQTDERQFSKTQVSRLEFTPADRTMISHWGALLQL
jgi:hypothetical protein